MLWLEMSGDVVGEVSLDPRGEFVTNFDIGGCEALGVPPNWLDVVAPTSVPRRVDEQ
ncbi:hypothetical protein GCM10009681_18600 [Luedemannella helvata]|uniref:Uncharacterized protein n=2 Tax=Luedemannella helvata TaxID=349315 RepID=A0ABN2K3Q7_9ACTN